MSPVFFSTKPGGASVSGLSAVSDGTGAGGKGRGALGSAEKPIVFVGNHQLLALDLGLIIQRCDNYHFSLLLLPPFELSIQHSINVGVATSSSMVFITAIELLVFPNDGILLILAIDITTISGVTVSIILLLYTISSSKGSIAVFIVLFTSVKGR